MNPREFAAAVSAGKQSELAYVRLGKQMAALRKLLDGVELFIDLHRGGENMDKLVDNVDYLERKLVAFKKESGYEEDTRMS